MAAKLVPYLNFNGNTREAMEYYKSIFGGELTMTTFGESSSTGDPELDKGIMHSELKSDGIHIMASEGMPGTPVESGNDVSLSLFGAKEDAETLREYFAKLSEGGSVTVPLAPAPWGDEFGMCNDRFGKKWLVNIAGM